jgi:hypothetical protein
MSYNDDGSFDSVDWFGDDRRNDTPEPYPDSVEYEENVWNEAQSIEEDLAKWPSEAEHDDHEHDWKVVYIDGCECDECTVCGAIDC